MSNITQLQYQGNVTISLKIKDKVKKLKLHNNGTAALQEIFARIMANDSDSTAEFRNMTPNYLDLCRSSDGEEWYTCLLDIINIPTTARRATIDDNNEWVARFTATIRYDDLIVPIESTDTDKFRLYLYYMNSERGRADLAYLDVSAIDISKISPGTQAIIEWDMKLKVNEG